MPYAIRYNTKKKCYSVLNKKTKRVFSKCTSLKRANRQSRLLRAIMFNKDFVPNAFRKSRGTRRLRQKKRGGL
jgi:hypothetical protein